MAQEKKKGKKSMKIWKVYQVAGGKAERKNKFCSKCGTGTFLAKHKDRETCGKCGYTTFNK